MCYMVILSTDSSEDLSAHNDEIVKFSRDLPPLAEVDLLAYPQKWFVVSRDSCSCGFRHLCVPSVELGFSEPAEWFPEQPEDIEATLRFMRVVRGLLEAGAHVDCIDAWGHESDSAKLIGAIRVDLSAIDDHCFRFFENHRFDFVADRSG